MTVGEALSAAAALGLTRLDAQWLLLHALGKPTEERAWLLAHASDDVPTLPAEHWSTLCARRAAGEPLAYITGHKEFFGLDLAVDARVLVPRPETETLVEWALGLDGGEKDWKVADLGCGSGAIALALKSSRPHWQVCAVDASADALAVAGGNAGRLGLPLELLHGSWLTPLSGRRFDLIVANPPYIAEGDPHLPALAAEPRQALVAGMDGLDDLRTIVAEAPAHLEPGGWLLLEHGYDQAHALRGLLTARGFAAVETRQDLAGIDRCTGGRWQTVK